MHIFAWPKGLISVKTQEYFVWPPLWMRSISESLPDSPPAKEYWLDCVSGFHWPDPFNYQDDGTVILWLLLRGIRGIWFLLKAAFSSFALRWCGGSNVIRPATLTQIEANLCISPDFISDYNSFAPTNVLLLCIVNLAAAKLFLKQPQRKLFRCFWDFQTLFPENHYFQSWFLAYTSISFELRSAELTVKPKMRSKRLWRLKAIPRRKLVLCAEKRFATERNSVFIDLRPSHSWAILVYTKTENLWCYTGIQILIMSTIN